MDNINNILNRDTEVKIVKDFLTNFELNKHNLATKKGLYIYGDPGSGKTTFITNLLKELDYDIIKYDAGDIRNKSIIETITKHNMSDKNVISMFYKKIQRIVIIMDEIDGMNNGDKGGINSLIKIIRAKKTKKQRLEEITLNPIICIGNYHMDKKIKELMKVCHVIELKSPTSPQIQTIVDKLMPSVDNVIVKDNIIKFIQGDLRKLMTIYELYIKKQNILNNNIIQNIFLTKSYNDDTRTITKKLINNYYPIEQHLTIMNETDRTIVGLLWHENIIDVLNKTPKSKSIPLYLSILDNMCFSDYIDRITFQKQIWQFNEMSSLIKTLKNNKIYHEFIGSSKKQRFNPTEVRFTKVLTKYSTEYNNQQFIFHMCQELNLDKKDLFSFFQEIRNKVGTQLYEKQSVFDETFVNENINKLDIKRIYKYMDKSCKRELEEFNELD